jgi:DNA-binding IscR family transcriptional regulator
VTDSVAPDSFDDVDEAVGEEWEAETTPYERVREVISREYTPRSAETVAADARTSPKTARKHLEALAEEGFVTASTGDHGGTYYRRSPESLVVEQATDVLSHVSLDELVNRIAAMRETITEFQTEYGVESPEELMVERANQTLSEASENEREIDPDTLQEWQTTRRNLAFANAALSIANAERFVGGDSSRLEENTSAS